MAGAQAPMCVPAGRLDKWEDGDLRPPAFLIFLDEAVFDAELGIAVAEPDAAAARLRERQGRDDMELQVGRCAVIDF